MVSCAVHRYVKKTTCGEDCLYKSNFNESRQAGVAYIVISSVQLNRPDLAGMSSAEKEVAVMQDVIRASNGNGMWYLYHKCEAEFNCNDIYIKKREQVKKLWGLLEKEIGKERNLSAEDRRRAFERASSSEYMKEMLGMRIGHLEEDSIAAFALIDLNTNQVLVPPKKRKFELTGGKKFENLDKIVNDVEMRMPSIDTDIGLRGALVKELLKAEDVITSCVSVRLASPETYANVFDDLSILNNLQHKAFTLMQGLAGSSSAPMPVKTENSCDYDK